MRAPRGLRDRAILETFYATGIRVTELCNLTPYDVDTEERVLRVILGKGRKDRNVPLTRAAAEAIEAYLVKGRPKLVGHHKVRFLFLQDRGGNMDRATASRIVAAWAEETGVKKHVTPHTFRHTVATHLLKGRADIRHIQAARPRLARHHPALHPRGSLRPQAGDRACPLARTLTGPGRPRP